MPPIRNPWTKYAVTKDNRKPVTEISHLAHIQPALRIIRDRKLKPGIVTESEVLKEEKIQATWLSPNNWYFGSRYGQVGFNFYLEKLLKRRHIYWVEAIAYTTPACRLLVTMNDYDHLLKPYDPEIENGPLIYEEGKYYWNEQISLQFLFDETLPTKRCSRIFLTKHHDSFCCLENKCSDKEKSMALYKVAQLLVSYLIAHDFEYDRNLFTLEATGMGRTKTKPEFILSQCVNHIIILASRADYFNLLNTKDEEVIVAIVKASMIHLANNDTASFKKVIGVLKNSDSFEESFLWLVQQKFALFSIEEFKE